MCERCVGGMVFIKRSLVSSLLSVNWSRKLSNLNFKAISLVIHISPSPPAVLVHLEVGNMRESLAVSCTNEKFFILLQRWEIDSS